jgi:hypothetical protein
MSHVPLSLTQRARRVDGAIELALAALYFDIGFVDVPASPHLAALPPPQILRQSQRELCLPVTHRFATEYDTADEAPSYSCDSATIRSFSVRPNFATYICQAIEIGWITIIT